MVLKVNDYNIHVVLGGARRQTCTINPHVMRSCAIYQDKVVTVRELGKLDSKSVD